jgi:hypothetical protein
VVIAWAQISRTWAINWSGVRQPPPELGSQAACRGRVYEPDRTLRNAAAAFFPQPAGEGMHSIAPLVMAGLPACVKTPWVD